MTEFERLSDRDPTGFAAGLIRAARRESPAPELRRASALAVGLGAAATATGRAAASTSLFKAVLTGVGKGFVGGLIATTALIYGSQLASRTAPPSHIGAGDAPVSKGRVRTTSVGAAPVESAPFSAPPAASFSDNDSSLPSTARTSSVAPRPLASKPTREVDRAPARTPAASNGSGRVVEEAANLGRAHAALERGDASGALAELDGYARNFPSGALVVEAETLRIEALARHGDFARARALASVFLARESNGPAARRVRSVLASLETSDASIDQTRPSSP